MQKHLFFICPTDYLESVIDSTFKQKKYYYSSLGNSIAFDAETAGQLSELLHAENITEVSFVLSDDNRIVFDALERQNFSEIAGLKDAYTQITRQKKHAEKSWQTHDHQFLLLSYYLNNRVRELKQQFKGKAVNQLKVNGIVYRRKKKQFSEIYPDLVCRESYALN